ATQEAEPSPSRAARAFASPRPFRWKGGNKMWRSALITPFGTKGVARNARGGMPCLRRSTQQRRHRRARFRHAGTGRCRERKHLRTRAFLRDFTFDFALARAHLCARQLVGLAEQ